MWNVNIRRDGHVAGMHKCPNERAWLTEPDGWAVCSFMFEDYYDDGYNACSVCHNHVPKETMDFYKLCKALSSDSSIG